MHAMSFLLKRGHLATTRAGQQVLYDVPGMTPARFDILCFLRQWPARWGINDRGYNTQRRLWQALGLSQSVMSRMLKRLEQMGWIERNRDVADRRINVVELTKLGLRKIWEAMRINFRRREIATNFEELARNLRPTQHVIESLDHLYDTLQVVAHHFGDESEFFYSYGSRRRLPFGFYMGQRPPRKPPEEILRELYDTPVEEEETTEKAVEKRYGPTPYQRWIAPLLKPETPRPQIPKRPKPPIYPVTETDNDDDVHDIVAAFPDGPRTAFHAQLPPRRPRTPPVGLEALRAKAAELMALRNAEVTTGGT